MDRSLRNCDSAHPTMLRSVLAPKRNKMRESFGSLQASQTREIVMSRRQLILWSAVTAITAITAIFAYQLRAHLSAAGSSFPELLELAPGNSTFIGYVDLAELRKQPLIARLAALATPVAVDRDYAEFISATGFDYRRDLDRVLIAANASQTLAIAEGRFDQKRIEEYALRSGTVEHGNDRAVYIIKSTTPGQNISLTFLDGHRLAVSESGDVAAYLARPPAPLDAAMRQRLSRVAGSPAFAGWKIGDSLARANGGTISPVLSALQSLRGLDVAIKPDGEQMLISLEGECENSAEAQKLSASLDLLRTILPVGLADPRMRGQLSAENAALAARLIQAAGISTDSERVRLLLTVTPDMIGGSAPAK